MTSVFLNIASAEVSLHLCKNLEFLHPKTYSRRYHVFSKAVAGFLRDQLPSLTTPTARSQWRAMHEPCQRLLRPLCAPDSFCVWKALPAIIELHPKDVVVKPDVQKQQQPHLWATYQYCLLLQALLGRLKG